MSDTDSRLGLRHVTVVPSNYDVDGESRTGTRRTDR